LEFPFIEGEGVVFRCQLIFLLAEKGDYFLEFLVKGFGEFFVCGGICIGEEGLGFGVRGTGL
jgi:hypothetical protein